MVIATFVICCVFALVFVYLTIQSIVKEKWGPATVFGVISGISVLCGLPWFQGLAKTWFVADMNRRFVAFGNQIDEAHKTIGEMQEQLSGQQRQINTNQSDLTRVQTDVKFSQGELEWHQGELRSQQMLSISNQALLSGMQTNIATAQSKLMAQAQQLANLEYWVVNLYSNVVVEQFAVGDTNKVVSLRRGDIWDYFVLLKSVPIHKSVRARTRGGQTDAELTTSGQDMFLKQSGPFLETRVESRNLYHFIMSSQIESYLLTVEYVRDQRATNLITKLEVVENRLLLDGRVTKFP